MRASALRKEERQGTTGDFTLEQTPFQNMCLASAGLRVKFNLVFVERNHILALALSLSRSACFMHYAYQSAVNDEDTKVKMMLDKMIYSI